MQETYTDVLRGASEDLLHALNDTPQRYIPTNIQGCMLGLRKTLYLSKKEVEESETTIKATASSEEIEDEATTLISELDEISGNMPAAIVRYIKNLRTVIAKRGFAS